MANLQVLVDLEVGTNRKTMKGFNICVLMPRTYSAGDLYFAFRLGDNPAKAGID